MELSRETRRFYYFTNPKGLIIDDRGIENEGEFIRFPRCYLDDPENPVNHDNRIKRTFSNPDECLKWVEQMTFKQNSRVDKKLYVKSEAVKADGGDFEKVKEFMIAPENFNPKDIRVYKSYLANNIVDRDRERFTPPVLMSFSKTIVGKPKLFGHAWGNPGEGICFDSEVVQKSLDESLKMIGPHPSKGIAEHLEDVKTRDGAIYWLVVKWYMLADNVELTRKIDAGIVSYESIGFRAPDKVAVKDKDGNVKWWEFVNTETAEAEALENSYVWLGSQYGARSRKKSFEDEDKLISFDEVIKPYAGEHACRLKDPGQYDSFARKNCEFEHEGKCVDVIYGISEGKSEIQALRFKKSVWTESAAKSYCDEKGGTFEAAAEKTLDKIETTRPETTEVKRMKIEVKALGIEGEYDLTDEGIAKLQADVIEKTNLRDEENKKVLDETKSELEKVKAVLGDLDTEKIKVLQEKSKLGDEYKQFLIEETNKFKVLCGFVKSDVESVRADQELLASMTVEQIKVHLEEFRGKWAQDHPNTGVLPENTETQDSRKVHKIDAHI
ncbi:hypothetical protein [Neomegalonema sp.]|uniref:hypothetical protein n=1 Tax=Neomegalonema sp. TaxID=2039713 RepID=UPI00261B372E|nr:hypothetical protein [Neomegalonema sp.]MDD2869672.1 hypothetical protein [Neomegalonema sp.]